MGESDEWVTVVPGGRSNKYNGKRKDYRKRKDQHKILAANKFTSNKFQNSKNRNKLRMDSSILSDEGSLELNPNVIHEELLKCMEHLKRSDFYVQSLLPGLRDAGGLCPDSISNKSKRGEESLNENSFERSAFFEDFDIVVFGIGNFGKKAFSASMLQLACALLLQRDLMTKDGIVPQLFYFEPMMSSSEKEVLLKFQSVKILQNSKGKHKVRKETLFFAPHCPMRLYSNIIWINWGSDLVEKIILFGNSFEAYDSRLLDRKDKDDITNCIFRTLEYTREHKVVFGDINEDELFNLSRAFNDCSIIKFLSNSIDSTLPSLESKLRPPDFEGEDSELM